MSNIWTEKYRPRHLNEIVLNDSLKVFFNEIITGNRSLPNLLLYGPPGSGKTTIALIVSSNINKENVLELNASNDREISVIRNKIKTFATTKAYSHELKIIIMDECDYLTSDAQHCLRRIIEDTYSTTRFIFITNYIHKIIDPIKSRLNIIFIAGRNKITQKSRISEIIKKENLNLNDDEVDYLLTISNNDLRKALVILQTISSCNILPGEYKSVIDEVCINIPDEIINLIIEVKSIKEAMIISEDIIRNSYPIMKIIELLSKKLIEVISKRYINIQEYLKILINLSEAEENLLSGGDDDLQINNIIMKFANANIITSI